MSAPSPVIVFVTVRPPRSSVFVFTNSAFTVVFATMTPVSPVLLIV